MQDIDKTRAEYVTHLESQLTHMVQRLNDALNKAKWAPVIEAADEGDKVRFVLSLLDKKVSVHVTKQSLFESDVTTITSAVVDSMVLNLVSSQIRTVVEPEVTKFKQSAVALNGAGKW
jgi:hypothetical protein